MTGWQRREKNNEKKRESIFDSYTNPPGPTNQTNKKNRKRSFLSHLEVIFLFIVMYKKQTKMSDLKFTGRVSEMNEIPCIWYMYM